MALIKSDEFHNLEIQDAYFRIENIRFINKTQVRASIAMYLTQDAASQFKRPVREQIITIEYDMNSLDNLYVQFYNAVKQTEEFSSAIDA